MLDSGPLFYGYSLATHTRRGARGCLLTGAEGGARVRLPPQMGEDPTHGLSRPEGADAGFESGWVATDVAARALRVSPRTIRRLIERGKLEARAEGEGIARRWLVSVDSLRAFGASRTDVGDTPRADEHEDADGGGIADVLREMSARLEMRTAEAVEMRSRLEHTERALSSLGREADRLREESERLRAELEAERSRGFWRKVFGGVGMDETFGGVPWFGIAVLVVTGWTAAVIYFHRRRRRR